MIFSQFTTGSNNTLHFSLFIYIFLFSLAVCQGITNRLNLLGTREDHYLNMVKTYSNCTVVLENLEITYMEEHRDLSFLRVRERVVFTAVWLETCSKKPAVDKVVNAGQMSEGTTHTFLWKLTCSRQIRCRSTGVTAS